MKTISRYIMTLALLMTAASGAWADEKTINWTIGNGDDSGWGGSVTQNGIKIQCNSDDAKVANSNPCFFECYESSEYVTFTISMEDGSDILGVNMTLAENGDAFQDLDGWTGSGDTRTWTGKAKSVDLRVNRKGYYDEFSNWNNQYLRVSALSVTVDAPAPEPAVEVTTNAAEEGATFTEASFAMPAYDATAEYELVRDMSIQMTAQVGDGTQEQPRYRVKKDGNNKFIPADMEMAAVPALFTVNDAIEHKALTQTQDYIVQIYAIDAEGQPTGEAMTLATFTFEPGIYAVKAVAAQGSDYDGETALSNTFKLFQGYEVQVAAGEYITYYKDEALYVENENAKLYTIASITESEAVLSSEISVAPALTPLLVFNSSDEAKTFLLIPTTDKTPDNVTAATQFVGTLEATTIPASTTGADNYALNGYAFVWVKTAIEVGANKCWLHIASQPAGARGNTRSITGGNGTTGIESIHNSQSTIDNEGWYDLNGRKLQSAPNRKGIYIHNGKKVVMK